MQVFKMPKALVFSCTALCAPIEGQASKINMWAGVCVLLQVFNNCFFESMETGKVFGFRHLGIPSTNQISLIPNPGGMKKNLKTLR